jgi:hypothetical protein
MKGRSNLDKPLALDTRSSSVHSFLSTGSELELGTGNKG